MTINLKEMRKNKKSDLIDSDRIMIESIRDHLFLYENEWKKFKTHYPKDANKINKRDFISMCIAKYYIKENYNEKNYRF